MLPKTWNDVLAFCLLVVIPALWVLDASPRWGFEFTPEVTGGLMVTWALVVQYYFRRSPPNGGPPG